MSVIRGSYSATYNGLNIGNTEIGFRHTYSYRGRNINFDAVGETPVDVIFSGMNMRVSFVAQEYDAAAIDELRWPFNVNIGETSPAGLSLWQAAKPLLLTGCNTLTDPQTILFPKAILAPDYDLDIDYSHKERPLPMQLVIFPVSFESDGSVYYSTPAYPQGCTNVVYFIETYW
jgi:hypothetical protein